MKKVSIVYGIHIMWYEYGMVAEHFESVRRSYEPIKDMIDLELRVFANRQTYIEEPDNDEVMELFESEILDSLLEDPWVEVDLTWVDMDQPFWCAPDQRREVTNPEGWVVWGEVDCLLPDRFFLSLKEACDVLPDPTFALTYAYRKMWDVTWNHVEHPLFKMAAYNEAHENMVIPPFNYHDYISQEQLNMFNSQFQTADVMRVMPPKLDGSLLAFWQLDEPLLPDGMHLGADDSCAMRAMDMLGIPQYHISNVLKGHNYKHPLKRLGTGSSREDPTYLKYQQEGMELADKFLKDIAIAEGLINE